MDWTDAIINDEVTATVLSPRSLPGDRLPVERVALGIADDYKPCVARLANGELLLTAFHQVKLPEGKIREDIIFFRSADGGRTWSEREVSNLLGREPYLSVLRDGTVLCTVHLLPQDVRNTTGFVHSYVHRSTDAGRTWVTTPIMPADLPGAPADGWVVTSRNVLELADGTIVLGVSAPKGLDYLWRSADGGRTWDRSLRCSFQGVEAEKLWWPFMGETVFHQAPNGDLLGLWRVDPRVFPLEGDAPPGMEKEFWDQFERLIVFRSTDGGASWTREPDPGTVLGEMYPAVLRLADDRLLLTFTVRDLHRPLGVHAVFGKEAETGFRFDFAHDRIVLDARTSPSVASGGGFGPTILAPDGALVTAYSWRDEDGHTHIEVCRWRA